MVLGAAMTFDDAGGRVATGDESRSAATSGEAASVGSALSEYMNIDNEKDNEAMKLIFTSPPIHPCRFQIA